MTDDKALNAAVFDRANPISVPHSIADIMPSLRHVRFVPTTEVPFPVYPRHWTSCDHPLGLFRANSGPEEFRSSAKMAFSALSANNFSSQRALGVLGNFRPISSLEGCISAWPPKFVRETRKCAASSSSGCARKVATIDHIGATEILLGKPVQMFAVPAMRGVSKYVPLNGRARVLRRLKLRNTFIRRRLGILVAHQLQDGTINTVLNDFVWRGSLGFDREARRSILRRPQ